MLSLSLASLLCSVLVTTAQNTTKLNTAAKAAGKLYFGTATDNPELTDNPYDAILSDPDMFGIITPGNSLKWVSRVHDVEKFHTRINECLCKGRYRACSGAVLF